MYLHPGTYLHPVQTFACRMCLSCSFAALHSHWALWEMAAKRRKSTCTPMGMSLCCLRHQCLREVEEGTSSQQFVVEACQNRSLSLLAQCRCWGSGSPLPGWHCSVQLKAAVCCRCRELKRHLAGCPCLPWPMCQAREVFLPDLCISRSCQGAVETTSSRLHFPLCLVFDRGSAWLWQLPTYLGYLRPYTPSGEMIQHLYLTPQWFLLSSNLPSQLSRVASRWLLWYSDNHCFLSS